MDLNGLVPAIVTPMKDDGAVDEKALVSYRLDMHPALRAFRQFAGGPEGGEACPVRETPGNQPGGV